MTRRDARFLSSTVLLACALALSACGGSNEPTSPPATREPVGSGADALTDQAADEADARASSTSLAVALLSDVRSLDPAAAAAEIAAAADGLFPPGCVARERDAERPGVVHLLFTDCAGVLGRGRVTGREVVTLSSSAEGGLVAALEGEGLYADGQPAHHEAVAELHVEHGARAIVWKSVWQAANQRGFGVTHHEAVTIQVDPETRCVVQAGDARATLAGHTVETRIEGLATCLEVGKESCPRGFVVHTLAGTGEKVEVTYDGSPEAHVRIEGGALQPVPIECPI
jgi:hypothetical protein